MREGARVRAGAMAAPGEMGRACGAAAARALGAATFLSLYTPVL